MCVRSIQYGIIETFLPPEVLKHFEIKIYKYFEICQVLMYNFYAKLI